MQMRTPPNYQKRTALLGLSPLRRTQGSQSWSILPVSRHPARSRPARSREPTRHVTRPTDYRDPSTNHMAGEPARTATAYKSSALVPVHAKYTKRYTLYAHTPTHAHVGGAAQSIPASAPSEYRRHHNHRPTRAATLTTTCTRALCLNRRPPRHPPPRHPQPSSRAQRVPCRWR